MGRVRSHVGWHRDSAVSLGLAAGDGSGTDLVPDDVAGRSGRGARAARRWRSRSRAARTGVGPGPCSARGRVCAGRSRGRDGRAAARPRPRARRAAAGDVSGSSAKLEVARRCAARAPRAPRRHAAGGLQRRPGRGRRRPGRHRGRRPGQRPAGGGPEADLPDRRLGADRQARRRRLVCLRGRKRPAQSRSRSGATASRTRSTTCRRISTRS